MKRMIIIRGGGEMATAAAHYLHMAGFEILLLERAHPAAVRREVSFADAVYEGEKMVERVTCYRADSIKDADDRLRAGQIVMMADPEGKCARRFRRHILINAIAGYMPEAHTASSADFSIGLGSGYCARRDVDCVIELRRGHNLGRIIRDGWASKRCAGAAKANLLLAPAAGRFKSPRTISNVLRPGDPIADICTDDGQKMLLTAPFAGVLRGLIHDDCPVQPGMVVAEVDGASDPGRCYTISDKARCVAGSVLAAVMAFESGNWH